MRKKRVRHHRLPIKGRMHQGFLTVQRPIVWLHLFVCLIIIQDVAAANAKPAAFLTNPADGR
jgi:hypothetical protein